jgi:hypothetical protein
MLADVFKDEAIFFFAKEDEAIRMVMEASAPPRAVMPAASASPHASVITMDLALSWPWEMPVFIDLTQQSDDDE